MLASRPLILLLAIPVTGLFAFLSARDTARKGAAARSALIRRALVGLATGGVVAVGSWYVLPTNPESPAMLITYFTSWIIGGGLIFFSLMAYLGALTGRPRAE